VEKPHIGNKPTREKPYEEKTHRGTQGKQLIK